MPVQLIAAVPRRPTFQRWDHEPRMSSTISRCLFVPLLSFLRIHWLRRTRVVTFGAAAQCTWAVSTARSGRLVHPCRMGLTA